MDLQNKKGKLAAGGMYVLRIVLPGVLLKRGYLPGGLRGRADGGRNGVRQRALLPAAFGKAGGNKGKEQALGAVEKLVLSVPAKMLRTEL